MKVLLIQKLKLKTQTIVVLDGQKKPPTNPLGNVGKVRKKK
jgi:hypothetical protein